MDFRQIVNEVEGPLHTFHAAIDQKKAKLLSKSLDSLTGAMKASDPAKDGVSQPRTWNGVKTRNKNLQDADLGGGGDRRLHADQVQEDSAGVWGGWDSLLVDLSTENLRDKIRPPVCFNSFIKYVFTWWNYTQPYVHTYRNIF